MQLGVNRRVGQPPFRRLGDAEINHFGHWHEVVQRHEDVRGLDVAMDDPLLVRVLDGLANLDEQIEPIFGGEIVLVAVVSDADTAHQFHHEVGPAHIGRARIEHLGNVRMIHHRQRLTLRFEPGDDLLGVHAQLDDLERHATPYWLRLIGHIHHAAATFADPLQKFVATEGRADGFIGCIGYFGLGAFDRFATRLLIFRFVVRQVGNKRLRFVGYGQHLLHARPQAVVALARLGEVGGPVLGRELPGGEVD